jgi:hypothetical protein
MEDLYIIAALVSICFFVIKIVEERLRKNEDENVKPMKNIIKDSAIVFICTIFGGFIYDQFFPAGKANGGASAFVDNPAF